MKNSRENQGQKLAVILSNAERLRASDLPAAIKLLERERASLTASPEIHKSLASCFQQAGQFLNALLALDRVIELKAATPHTWAMAGVLLMNFREYAQAAAALRNAVDAEPDNASYRHDLGKALYQLGDVSQAAREMEIACETCEELLPWASLATIAPGNPDYSNEDVLRIRRTYAAMLCEAESPRVDASYERPTGRMKVAYFSSWFDKENYMKPVWGLVNAHDRSKLEVILLSDTPAENLPGYRRCEQDEIYSTGAFSNQELRDFIQKLGVHILVDLNAYSEIPRLGLFTQRLEPITVAWFNMYATSGFPGFDYIIGDNITARPEEEEAFSERVLRLPQSYLTFTVSHAAPPIVAPPCLENGQITFGSLCSQYKLTDAALDAWATIMQRVPESRLLLGNVALDSTCNRDYLKEKFEQRGIDASRIEMRGQAIHSEFLEYYNSIDIALDAFPYNGGTTTMEAAWQGVPVITFDGDRWASRTSASILAGSHLMDFVARDESSYINLAVELATRPDVGKKLMEIRNSTRERLLHSSACHTDSLALAVEDLFLSLLDQ